MIFFIVILVVIIIGFLIYFYNPKQKIIRILKKLPTKNIGSLKTGELSKITGKALRVTEPLIAPLSKRKCVFYSMTIEQEKSSGKSSHWDKIVHEEKIQHFFIEKNGDVVMVKPTKDPTNYKSFLVVDRETASGTFNDPDIEFQKVLKGYDIKSTGFLGFNKQLRYTEGIIEIGEEITVAGIAKWKSLSEPIEGYSYSKIATLESTDTQKLIITDLPQSNFNNR